MIYAKEEYLKIFRRELTIRKYSVLTICNYCSTVKQFLGTWNNDPGSVTIDYVKKYIYAKCEKFYSANTIAMIINGLKAFYQMVLQSHLLDELHQPKRPKTLPNILNHDEILAICSSIKNRKHRCMIAMMYGSGLRLHELVNLKVKDIDFENVRLVVRTTNGNKARLTILSEKLVDTLRLYMKNKTPNDHVFTSSLNKKYSKRTVQCILEKALQAANIGKHASCHVLRHSFATHLLEDGVSVVTIQKLLGHTSVKTTMIYTRLARHSLGDIKSPL